MKKVKIFLILITIHTLSFGSPVRVGNQTIDIPTPDGMIEINEDTPEALYILNRLSPPGTRSIKIFIIEGDYNSSSDEPMRMLRIFQPKSLENVHVSKENFNTLKRLAKETSKASRESIIEEGRQDAKKALDRLNKETYQNDKDCVTLDNKPAEEISPPFETENTYSISASASYSIGGNSYKYYTRTILVHVKNTILTIHITAPIDAQEWANKASQDLAIQILKKNTNN